MLAKVCILFSLGALALAGPPAYYGGAYGGAYGYGAPALSYAAPALSYAAPAYRAPALLAAPALHAAPAFAAPAFHAPAIAKVHAAPIIEAPQPYEFGYNRQHEDGAVVHRQETSDAYNNKQGSYGYTGPDGIYRQVNYVADAAGYRATISTNEPGTANQNPAAVSIAAAEPPYKVLAHAAPVVKAIHAAPILHAAPAYHAAPLLRAAPAFSAPAYHAAPALLRAAPAYAHHGFAAPAVVKSHGYGYAY